MPGYCHGEPEPVHDSSQATVMVSLSLSQWHLGTCSACKEDSGSEIQEGPGHKVLAKRESHSDCCSQAQSLQVSFHDTVTVTGSPSLTRSHSLACSAAGPGALPRWPGVVDHFDCHSLVFSCCGETS